LRNALVRDTVVACLRLRTGCRQFLGDAAFDSLEWNGSACWRSVEVRWSLEPFLGGPKVMRRCCRHPVQHWHYVVRAIDRALLIPRFAERVAALVPGAVVLAAGAADGGFFPTAWGLLAIALFSLAGIGLLVRERIVLGSLEWGVLVGLAALVAWIALSMVWSASPLRSLREAERGLIYVAGVFAVLITVRRRALAVLLGGVVAAISAIAAYGFVSRLFPTRPIAVDPVEGTLLIEPLGYANALGLLAAIGLLLALTVAAAARTPLARALAAAAPILLLPVLYLSASRGAWLALVGGLAVALAFDPKRLRSIALLLTLAPAGALAVWFTVAAHALRDPQARLAEAARSGHRLALALALLALAAAGASFVIDRVEAALRRQRAVLLTGRRRRAVLLGGATVVIAALVFAGLRSAGEPGVLGDRPAYWRVARAQYEAHPWLGSGAGTFEQYWQRARPIPVDVRDAHNLYLETLAELGPLGLASLLVALLVPLRAGMAARRHQLAPGATGAYVAFLVHAGLDWDWEMPAVTLAALLCAAGGLLAARREGRTSPIAPGLRIGLFGGSLILALLALAGLLDNVGLLTCSLPVLTG
jgi:hypothetical protein